MRRWKLALLAMIPVFVFGLSACGGNGAKGNAAPQSKKTDDLAAMRNFAKCMRENGVNMPDPTDDGGGGVRIESGEKGGGDPEKFKAAQQKCRHLRPNGGEEPNKMSAEQVARAREHSKCMREHGIEMPDPDEDGRIRIRNSPDRPGEVPVGGDPNSQKFKDAEKACQHLRPMLGTGEVKGD